MSNLYIGQEVQLTLTLTQLVDGVQTATDPTSCTVTIRTPAGTTTAYVWPGAGAISHPATGSLVWTGLATTAGRWFWRAETDTHTVGEGTFVVVASGTPA